MDIQELLKYYTEIVEGHIKYLHKDLNVLFTGYENEQFEIRNILSKNLFQPHGVLDEARILLKKLQDQRPHGFTGFLAPGFPNSTASRKHNHVAVFIFNLERLSNDLRPEATLYHHMYQLLDKYPIFKEQPQPAYTPEIKSYANIRVNLKADLFSMFMLSSMKYKKVIHEITYKRAKQSTSRKEDENPEFFPSLIASETVKLARDRLTDPENLPDSPIDRALHLTEYVAALYDEYDLKAWFVFCEQLQTMLWLGMKVEDALGSALDLSASPKVRTYACAVCEYLKIEPPFIEKNSIAFNAFTRPEINRTNHVTLVSAKYFEVMSRVQKHFDSLPVLEEINKQNINLTSGYAFGWCAFALMQVYDSLEKAPHQIPSGSQFAKFQFEENKLHLHDEAEILAKYALKNRRQGKDLSVQDLIDIAESKKMTESIVKCLKFTLKTEIKRDEKKDVPVSAFSDYSQKSEMPGITLKDGA